MSAPPGTVTLLALPGSLRTASFNRRLLRCAIRAAEARGARVDLLDLTEQPLPFFNGDLEREAGLPAEVEAFRARIAAADGVLIATPEYNGSVPAVLKNAIDWASRKRPTQPWDGKPVLLMGATPGKRGAARVLAHLRETVLANVRVRLVAEPLGIAHAEDAFGPEDTLRDAAQQQALEDGVAALLDQIAADPAPAPGSMAAD